MFDNILNDIPVVGHLKGVYHYLDGDEERGHEAMIAANRTTAVMAGGIAGIPGGPAGMAAGAMAAGLLVDTAATAVGGEPFGYLENVDEIVTDIRNGDVPIKSAIKTGLSMGADVLTGCGTGTFAKNLGRAMGKPLAKDASKVFMKNLPAYLAMDAGTMTRVFNNENAGDSSGTAQASSSSSKSKSKKKKSQNSNPNQSGSSYASSSGSGSQPPKKPNNSKKSHELEEVTHIDAFLSVFDVLSLDDICIRGFHIFRNLDNGSLKTLKKLIKTLRLNNCLWRVVRTVKIIFNRYDLSDVTFLNFISLAQFVAAYFGEQAAQLSQAQRATQCSRRGCCNRSLFETRREENFDDVTEAAKRTGNLLTTLAVLQSEIGLYHCSPNFRNVFSAMYHYIKHRVIPNTDIVLSVNDYFCLIDFMLHHVKTLSEYTDLTDEFDLRRELVLDKVIILNGKKVRLRIVLKFDDGKLVLSSCYALDDDCENYEVGEEFIDPDKRK